MRKVSGKFVLWGAGASWLVAQSALGFVAPDRQVAALSPALAGKQRVIRPHLGHSRSFLPAKDLSVQHDQVSGQARVISGSFGLPVLAVSAGSQAFVAQARSYLAAHPEWFGVAAADVQVVEEALLITDDVQFIKFAVFRDGLRIHDASLDFRFKFGKLVQIVNHSFAEAPTPVWPDLAEDLGAAFTRATGLAVVKSQGLHWRVELDEAAQAYRLVKVKAFLVAGEHGPMTAEMSTHKAELFELRSNLRHFEVDAVGDSYKRWYTEGLETTKLDFVEVSTDAGPIYPVAGEPRLDGLKGRFVSIKNLTGDGVALSGERVGERWRLHVKSDGSQSAWLDKTIAQVMVYRHTNFIVAEAKKHISHPWLEKALEARTNLDASCNAHWDGSTINLYSGSSDCANTGLISDVIYHEWGHGLDDKTGGIEDGAFSEGYGDILSLIYTRSPLLGIGFELANHAPVRDLEPDFIYPRDQGEVHDEGQIIGSTFWDLFKAMRDVHGADKTQAILANYAFKMIFTARTYLDVYEAIQVIDDDDAKLENGTPNLCLINEAFAKHGLTTSLEACKLAAIDSFSIDDNDADSVIEPGETITLQAKAYNAKNTVLEGLTGTLTLAPLAGVTVTQSALQWDAIPAQTRQLSQQGAQITVDEGVACGSKLQANIALRAGAATVVSQAEFTVGKNSGSAQAYTAATLPLPIEDRQTVQADIAVDGAAWSSDHSISDASLAFTINHSYLGDVVVRLVSPQGESFDIYQGKGRGDGKVSYKASLTGVLAGKKGRGTWKLKIQDKGRFDEGSLEAVSLTLTPAIFVCD